MSDVEEFLEHYGVKGQRWGVRRANKKSAKADKKWQANVYSSRGAVDVHNSTANKMNGGVLDRLNGQAKYNKLNALDTKASLTKQYFREYEKLVEKHTAISVREVHGVSPSGKLKATLDTSGDQWSVKVSPVDVTHVNVSPSELLLELNHDDSGYIVSAKMVQTSIEQGEDLSIEFLEHYGVKGQKWGVRRKSSKKGISRSPDSQQALKIYNKSQKKGIRSLTNKEIQTYTQRMQLQRQFANLMPRSNFQKGKDFTKEVLGIGKSYNEVIAFVDSPGGKQIKDSFKKSKK